LTIKDVLRLDNTFTLHADDGRVISFDDNFVRTELPLILDRVWSVLTLFGIPRPQVWSQQLRRPLLDELRRRNNCRSRLADVLVSVRGEGDQLHRVLRAAWAQNQTLMCTLRTEPHEDGDLDRLEVADDLLLASEWPIGCRCWLAETDEV
jgi:hypothetical protein